MGKELWGLGLGEEIRGLGFVVKEGCGGGGGGEGYATSAAWAMFLQGSFSGSCCFGSVRRHSSQHYIDTIDTI